MANRIALHPPCCLSVLWAEEASKSPSTATPTGGTGQPWRANGDGIPDAWTTALTGGQKWLFSALLCIQSAKDPTHWRTGATIPHLWDPRPTPLPGAQENDCSEPGPTCLWEMLLPGPLGGSLISVVFP